MCDYNSSLDWWFKLEKCSEPDPNVEYELIGEDEYCFYIRKKLKGEENGKEETKSGE